MSLVITTFIAFWARKTFEVLLFVYGLTDTQSAAAASRINARIG
jgi:hypothetical protein